MSDRAVRFHETWLGMVQPIEGLVVSVPVLVDAQCMARQPPATRERLRELCPPTQEDDTGRTISDLLAFFSNILKLTPDLFDRAEALPEDLALYVPEGRQTIRPSMALRQRQASPAHSVSTPPETAATRAGSAYTLLVWELPQGLDFDKPETQTGAWEHPPAAKFDRLLRHTGVKIGLVTNGLALRLIYAPHGESSGAITFRIDDMASAGGRPILDALVMLLSAFRLFGAPAEQQLPAILEESRKRQLNVTNELSRQVGEALEILLRGFEGAAERDADYRAVFRDALEREDDHVYGGILTALLRMVFILYAEDRALLPIDSTLYANHLSLLALFDTLQQDQGTHPDTMARRFGAWPRFITLCRAIYLGAHHGDLSMPKRQGSLFDPQRFPFLEGWAGGSAPITMAENRAHVRIPTIDDGTVFRVLHKLLMVGGQRLSYRSLDVEQIGSVYEGLMGYHLRRLVAPAVCLGTQRVWVSVDEVEAVPPAQRAKWLKLTTGLTKSRADKLAKALAADDDTLAALESERLRGTATARPDQLVVQPGAERRRTSSHYTPRSLSAPIVSRTLEPLIRVLGDTPTAEALLELKVCDPAMGSGAFLVEACRYLADRVVAAWTRAGAIETIADPEEDVTNLARRLVAQSCLYGVDKNAFAVDLAKLSLWLVTLSRNAPFTFLDHALRHGDSLVGLDFEQTRAFHWQPSDPNAKGVQLDTVSQRIDQALDEALDSRRRILEMALRPGSGSTRDKERLLRDAEDALSDARLIADLVTGAFFSKSKAKERDFERRRRLGLVEQWLGSGDDRPEELAALQEELHQRLPAFHWALEFPEVFFAGRGDPLDHGRPSEAAMMDAIIGNPPFAGKNLINELGGPGYLDWLKTIHPGAHGNADYSAHFFRRADVLNGAHGTIGLIATNTIAQGDTRATGLQALIARGHTIYEATRSMPWPGESAVAVSVVHLAKGAAARGITTRRLGDAEVPAINSRLRGKPERPDPQPLAANAGLSFVGSYVLGMGFTLTPEERDALVARSPRNAELIQPYIGGEEVNSSPTHDFHRYVINFGSMTLEEAAEWPDLLRIVRERVKPERDRNKRDVYRKRWWQYGEKRPALYEAIRSLPRCLVTAQVTKHLCFSFQPTGRIYSQKLIVFPFEDYATFAILQSRVHEAWTRLLSSTLRGDLNYAPSDCFSTFPFPQADPWAAFPGLAKAGQELYDVRAKYMVETDQGLTPTYNLLKDSACDAPAIVELRRLHEALDCHVLGAYGWEDVAVPPYLSPTCEAEAMALEAFQDEVLDRLFILNAERSKAAPKEELPAARSR